MDDTGGRENKGKGDKSEEQLVGSWPQIETLLLYSRPISKRREQEQGLERGTI